jgi:hypothetical protein
MSEASDTWRLNALHVTIDDKDREIEKLRNQLSVLQHYRYGEADCLGCQERDEEIDRLTAEVARLNRTISIQLNRHKEFQLVYDELEAENARLREPWQRIAAYREALKGAELNRYNQFATDCQTSTGGEEMKSVLEMSRLELEDEMERLREALEQIANHTLKPGHWQQGFLDVWRIAHTALKGVNYVNKNL